MNSALGFLLPFDHTLYVASRNPPNPSLHPKGHSARVGSN